MQNILGRKLGEDHRGEMGAILGLVLMGMIVYVIFTALTPTVAQQSKSAADNMDNIMPGNSGSGLIRLGGTTLWALLGIGIVAIVLLKMFGYV